MGNVKIMNELINLQNYFRNQTNNNIVMKQRLTEMIEDFQKPIVNELGNVDKSIKDTVKSLNENIKDTSKTLDGNIGKSLMR